MSSFQRLRPEFLPLGRLALPLVAGLGASTALMLTDTWMLGPLGPLPLAAASLTSSVLLILWAALYGFMGPVGLLAARAYGAGDAAALASVVRHGCAFGAMVGGGGALLMIGALFLLPYAGQPPEVIAVIAPYWVLLALMLLPYGVSLVFKQVFDAIDRPWTGVALMFTAVAVNLPLNYVLISGRLGFPALGLAGAGVATLLAECTALGAFWLTFRHAEVMRPYRIPVPLGREGFAAQAKAGFPMGIQYLAEGGAVAVSGVLIGLLGAVALAANQIVFSVESLLYMLPLGVASATGIRISQAMGSGELQRVRPIGHAALLTASVWTLVLTLPLAFGGATVARAFVDDPAVIATAAAMFIAVGLMQFFDGIQTVSLGALRGMHDHRWPMVVTLVAYWLVALPLGWLLAITLDLGAAGFWSGFAIGLALAAVVLALRFERRCQALTSPDARAGLAQGLGAAAP